RGAGARRGRAAGFRRDGAPAVRPGGHRDGDAAARPRPAPRMTRTRLLVRTLGELLMTAGGLVLLFVVWQLWWTDVPAAATADRALEQLQEPFAGPAEAPAPTSPGTPDEPEPTAPDAAGEEPAYEPGEGLAIVHLPTIDQTVAVHEGVDLDVLNLGVLGHYPGTALPGEVGNFAVAGHRTT